MKLFALVLCFSAVYSANIKEIPTIHPLELVVKGNNASDGQFPFLVSVQTQRNGHICGGNIINNRWILTAAHCLKDNRHEKSVSEMLILTGTNNLDKGGIKYNIEQINVHESFNFAINENDIALLKTSREIEFNSKTSLIPLGSDVPSGSTVTSGGWGESIKFQTATNNLQYIDMRVISLSACKYQLQYSDIFNHNVCTQPSGGLGTCAGDSGGPLVYNNELVGVLSWGEKCGGPAPEVYTRVDSFRDWIQDKIN